MALVGMLKNNTTLNDLDISLNQFELAAEIALMSLAMERPETDLTWKSPGAVSDWSAEECNQIIQHFGVTPVNIYHLSLFFYFPNMYLSLYVNLDI